MKNSNIIELKKYTVDTTVKINQSRGQYHCAMAKERMTGYCEVLIHDRYREKMELFCLDFSKDGLGKHQYLHPEETRLWWCENDTRPITYEQAMTLLSDAVQKGYKNYVYEKNCVGANDIANPWECCTSHHVQYILQDNFQNMADGNLDWLLRQLTPVQFVETYLSAINNRDAVLVYDMWATTTRMRLNRNVYAYTWNHVLEDVQIKGYEVLYSKSLFDEQVWLFYLCIFGEKQNKRALEVDMCIKLILEDGCLRIQEERVLDAIYVML